MLGVVFVVFAGLAAAMTYEYDKLAYTSALPSNFIATAIITSMLPYIASAVVSLTVAGIISRSLRLEDEEIEAEAQHEASEASATETF